MPGVRRNKALRRTNNPARTLYGLLTPGTRDVRGHGLTSHYKEIIMQNLSRRTVLKTGAIGGAVMLASVAMSSQGVSLPTDGKSKSDRKIFELIAQCKPLLARCNTAVTDQEVDEASDALWEVEEAIYGLRLESPRALAAQLSFHNDITERNGMSVYANNRDRVLLRNLAGALERMGAAT